MVGVYLIVWDSLEKEKTRLLRPTRSGWPHMTLVYMGRDTKMVEEAIKLGRDALDQWTGKMVTLDRAVVSSYQRDRDGKWFHDVLLGVAEQQMVEQMRTEMVQRVCGVSRYDVDYVMRRAHVTHASFETREEAEQCAKALEPLLPRQVTVAGVTVY